MFPTTMLLSVAEARRHLSSAFFPLESESVALSQACGRVLAEEIASALDLPQFDNSSMDGFALRAGDVLAAGQSQPIPLQVVADIPAGQVSPIVLRSGQTARIMTGAPLPGGADAVVPLEDTDHTPARGLPQPPLPAEVQIYRPVAVGDFVRPKGQDVRAGEIVLPRGTCLRPQEIGLLAMLAIACAPVYRRPRVALLSTGDELLPLEIPLTPGKIHDSNAYTLAALVEREGGEVIRLGIAPDREEAIRALLERAVADRADLILSSAGVSVGAFDFVRSVVEQNGQLDFWRVNMRPGKPLAFGRYRQIPFIGLPGNPVSAFIGFEAFVRPALRKMLGLPETPRPAQRVELLEPLVSDGRESYLRAVVTFRDGIWIARLAGHQGSGNLRSLTEANALLIIPSGVKSLPAGAQLEAWLI